MGLSMPATAEVWSTVLITAVALALFAPAQGVVVKVDLFRKNSNLDKSKARASRNVLYYGAISLGDPGQDLTVCFDTGSADLWVPSIECENPSCLTHTRFDPSLSHTQDTGGQFDIKYGTGAVHGRVVTDVLRFSEPPIVVPDQGFGLATEHSADFASASCDGIFGLALPGLSKQGQMPAFFRMLEGGMLDEPLFSIWLSPDPTTEPAGKILFGGHNPQRYIGDLVDLPVISRKYWMVALDGVAVGRTMVPSIRADGAIMDTGTSLITTSSKDAAAINSAIPGMVFSAETKTWRLSEGCAAVDSLPPISFVMGGTPFTLGPHQYMIQVGAGADMYCMSGIVGNGPEGKIVMGASFLRAYYSVYTYDLASGNAWVSLAPSSVDVPGTDSEGVEITAAAAAAGEPLSASSVFVTPRKDEKPAVGEKWAPALQTAPAPRSFLAGAAPMAAPAVGPAGTAGQFHGSVSSFQATAAIAAAAPSASGNTVATHGPASTAGASIAGFAASPAVAPMPGQAQPALAQPAAQSKPGAALSKGLNSPADHVYSAALAATAYLSEGHTLASPSPAPHQLNVPGVTSFGQMLGGRRRLRA